MQFREFEARICCPKWPFSARTQALWKPAWQDQLSQHLLRNSEIWKTAADRVGTSGPDIQNWDREGKASFEGRDCTRGDIVAVARSRMSLLPVLQEGLLEFLELYLLFSSHLFLVRHEGSLRPTMRKIRQLQNR